MTEDEAKTKWCPFVRLHIEGRAPSFTVAPNREQRGTHCIASACMAWRTRHQWLDNAQQNPDWVSYAPYAFEPGEGQERDDGYCGLAGAPQ